MIPAIEVPVTTTTIQRTVHSAAPDRTGESFSREKNENVVGTNERDENKQDKDGDEEEEEDGDDDEDDDDNNDDDGSDTECEDDDDDDDDELEEDTKYLFISQDDSLDCYFDEDDEVEEDDDRQLVDLTDIRVPKCVEKSVIIHRDEGGFGIRLRGQAPVIVDQVQENGAAWRAGVRRLDMITKVNGIQVGQLDHKAVMLSLKNCSRFVGLTLLTSLLDDDDDDDKIDSKKDTTTSIPKQQVTIKTRRHQTLATTSSSSTVSVSSLFQRRRNNSIAIFPDARNEKHKSIEQGTDFDTRSYRSVIGRKYSTQEPNLQCYDSNLQNTDKSKSITNSGNQVTSNQQGSDRLNEGVNVEAQICINCHTKLEKASNGPQCDKCRADQSDKQNKTTTTKTISQQDGRSTVSRFQNPTFQRLLRAHLSLRDNQKHSQTSLRAVNNNRAQESTQCETPSKENFYRLGQSASTTSLPIEKVTSIDSNRQNVHNQSHYNSGTIRQVPRVVNKRLEIIRELIETEKTHTDKLKCLDELFYRPLKEGGYMTVEQLRSIFSCHKTLYKIHRQIYRTLLSANYGIYSEPLIGSALIEIFEGPLRRRLEKAACSYCSTQATNAELLNKLTRKDSRIGDFLTQVSNQQMVGRLGIKDLLASCFQRLTKYPLLLENLLRSTPEKPSDLTFQTKIRSTGQNCNGDPDDSNQIERYLENSHAQRMLAISLTEEREFIERALNQSRQILFKVNDSIKVAMSRVKLREIWKRTDKYPGVPSIDITNQQVLHEGFLTLRLSKRSFDVYMLLLNDYIIILTRDGQDKYRLKFFTPEGKFAGNSQTVYSPIFIIDEHLTTRDAATDENGFYLLCKRKDDSRIYEFASRSPAERLKWRDRIQWTIEKRMSNTDRRLSTESTITKSSSETSAKQDADDLSSPDVNLDAGLNLLGLTSRRKLNDDTSTDVSSNEKRSNASEGQSKQPRVEDNNLVGTISYVEDDGIIMPSMMKSIQIHVDQATQVTFFNATKTR